MKGAGRDGGEHNPQTHCVAPFAPLLHFLDVFRQATDDPILMICAVVMLCCCAVVLLYWGSGRPLMTPS